MHEHEITVAVDLPVLAADYLAETDVLDRTLVAVGQWLVAAPIKLAAWLGPELKTPENSPAPRVVPAEPGPWTGMVFLEHDEPRFWVLARSSGRTSRHPVPPIDDCFAPVRADQFGLPRDPRHDPSVWAEHDERDRAGAPWESPSWRGGR